MLKVVCITTFLHSINVTRESNENDRFSARLGLAKLMPGREIEHVVFRIKKTCGVFTFTEAYLYAKVGQI